MEVPFYDSKLTSIVDLKVSLCCLTWSDCVIDGEIQEWVSVSLVHTYCLISKEAAWLFCSRNAAFWAFGKLCASFTSPRCSLLSSLTLSVTFWHFCSLWWHERHLALVVSTAFCWLSWRTSACGTQCASVRAIDAWLPICASSQGGSLWLLQSGPFWPFRASDASKLPSRCCLLAYLSCFRAGVFPHVVR